MRNKKLINRKKKTTLHKDSVLLFLISPWKRKGKKEKKKLLQHGVFVFSHPSKYYLRRTGLNFVEQKKHVAVFVVYGERLFLNSQMGKGIKKRQKNM